MRKSIFDIASERVDIKSEVHRIIHVATEEETLCINEYEDKTIFDFVDEHCFVEWEQRGHFINVKDFLCALDFVNLTKQAETDSEALLTVIELVYNFWYLCFQKLDDFQKGYVLQWCGNFYHLRDIMDDILEQYNHAAFTSEKKDCVLIVENKGEVTAVAEILPAKLAFDTIKYNHRSLQGEIELKKSILISLGAELEPKRKELQSIDKRLSEDIFFMLNNIDIRHNNRSKKDKAKYKEYVAKMTKKQLENWYDELYQMLLLAFLLLDNVDRTAKVKELKDKIVGENGNGQIENALNQQGG